MIEQKSDKSAPEIIVDKFIEYIRSNTNPRRDIILSALEKTINPSNTARTAKVKQFLETLIQDTNELDVLLLGKSISIIDYIGDGGTIDILKQIKSRIENLPSTSMLKDLLPILEDAIKKLEGGGIKSTKEQGLLLPPSKGKIFKLDQNGRLALTTIDELKPTEANVLKNQDDPSSLGSQANTEGGMVVSKIIEDPLFNAGGVFPDDTYLCTSHVANNDPDKKTIIGIGEYSNILAPFIDKCVDGSVNNPPNLAGLDLNFISSSSGNYLYDFYCRPEKYWTCLGYWSSGGCANYGWAPIHYVAVKIDACDCKNGVCQKQTNLDDWKEDYCVNRYRGECQEYIFAKTSKTESSISNSKLTTTKLDYVHTMAEIDIKVNIDQQPTLRAANLIQTPEKLQSKISFASGSSSGGTPSSQCQQIPPPPECPITPPTCDCIDWRPGNCGAGSCSSTQRSYTRYCVPAGCDIETKCQSDSSCIPSPSPQSPSPQPPSPQTPTPGTVSPTTETSPPYIGPAPAWPPEKDKKKDVLAKRYGTKMILYSHQIIVDNKIHTILPQSNIYIKYQDEIYSTENLQNKITDATISQIRLLVKPDEPAIAELTPDFLTFMVQNHIKFLTDPNTGLPIWGQNPSEEDKTSEPLALLGNLVRKGLNNQVRNLVNANPVKFLQPIKQAANVLANLALGGAAGQILPGRPTTSYDIKLDTFAEVLVSNRREVTDISSRTRGVLSDLDPWKCTIRFSLLDNIPEKVNFNIKDNYGRTLNTAPYTAICDPSSRECLGTVVIPRSKIRRGSELICVPSINGAEYESSPTKVAKTLFILTGRPSEIYSDEAAGFDAQFNFFLERSRLGRGDYKIIDRSGDCYNEGSSLFNSPLPGGNYGPGVEPPNPQKLLNCVSSLGEPFDETKDVILYFRKSSNWKGASSRAYTGTPLVVIGGGHK